MKILHLIIIGISSMCLIITNNLVFADSAIQHVIIDGTISEDGCKVINGTITQALDIQNMPIPVCNYHGKHFKLSARLSCVLISVGDTRDPETGRKYAFNVVCDEPTTCGLKNSWGGYNKGNMGNTDWLPATTVNGTRFVITTNYDEGVCLSEAYDEQEKKIILIADGLWKNDTIVNVLVPKVLLTNVAVTVDGQKVDPLIIDHNSLNNTLICSLCYYDMNIHLSSSPIYKKIEIRGQSIPEFPFAIPILLISIISLVVFYRIKFRK